MDHFFFFYLLVFLAVFWLSNPSIIFSACFVVLRFCLVICWRFVAALLLLLLFCFPTLLYADGIIGCGNVIAMLFFGGGVRDSRETWIVVMEPVNAFKLFLFPCKTKK